MLSTMRWLAAMLVLAGCTSPDSDEATPSPADPPADNPAADLPYTDAPETCESVTCSGHGTCVLGAGKAQCACEDGYGAVGKECLPCSAVKGESVNLPMLSIRGTFTLNGAEAPKSEYDAAKVSLANAAHGDAFLIGLTSYATYDVSVLPGQYELRVDGASAKTVPQNSFGLFGSYGVLSDVSEPIDVPAATVKGALTVGGSPPPTSPSDYGRIYAVNTSTNDEALLGATNLASYERRLVPGTYTLVYRSVAAGAVTPRNKNAVIGQLVVKPGTSVIPIDVPVASINGAITVNGQPPPSAPAESGALLLREGKDELLLGLTHAQSYQANVVPGTYDVHYRLEAGGVAVPVNTNGRVGSIVVSKSGSHGIDVAALPLSVQATLDGAAFPDSVSEYGDITAESAAPGDVIKLGTTRAPKSALVVAGGDYAVFYSYKSGSLVPGNTHAKIGVALPSAVAGAAVDVKTAKLAGSFKVNGAAAPTAPLESARVHLRDAGSADEVFLGATHLQSYAVRVIRGKYDVHYAYESGSVLPRNQDAIVGEVTVASSQASYDVQVARTTLKGSITVNRKTPSKSAYQSGDVFLVDPKTGASTLAAKTTHGQYDLGVIPGTYEIFYAAEGGGGEVPANRWARVSCASPK